MHYNMHYGIHVLYLYLNITKLNTNVVQEATMCLKKYLVKATSQPDVAKQSVQIIRTSIQLKG